MDWRKALACGVTLYVMVVGAYPFEDPSDARNFRKTIQRILGVQYQFPAPMGLSNEVRKVANHLALFHSYCGKLNLKAVLCSAITYP